jgi:hypothetical protein
LVTAAAFTLAPQGPGAAAPLLQSARTTSKWPANLAVLSTGFSLHRDLHDRAPPQKIIFVTPSTGQNEFCCVKICTVWGARKSIYKRAKMLEIGLGASRFVNQTYWGARPHRPAPIQERLPHSGTKTIKSRTFSPREKQNSAGKRPDNGGLGCGEERGVRGAAPRRARRPQGGVAPRGRRSPQPLGPLGRADSPAAVPLRSCILLYRYRSVHHLPAPA